MIQLQTRAVDKARNGYGANWIERYSIDSQGWRFSGRETRRVQKETEWRSKGEIWLPNMQARCSLRASDN